MSWNDLSPEEIAAITAFVDVHAPPPEAPTAHLIFGTNQRLPVDLVAERHLRGLAPFVIATGGVNRHTGVVEGREFAQWLTERGVAESAIRCEASSANTWQNVRFALPYLREAMESGLAITAVCKWYHRRAIHSLRTCLDVEGFYALTFEPVYNGTPITRTNWPQHPDGRHRVIREAQEVPRLIAEGTFKEAAITNGAWR